MVCLVQWGASRIASQHPGVCLSSSTLTCVFVWCVNEPKDWAPSQPSHNCATQKSRQASSFNRNKILLTQCAQPCASHGCVAMQLRLRFAMKMSSETYVIQKHSPHATVPLKSNDKRAVLTKIRSVDAIAMRVTIA